MRQADEWFDQYAANHPDPSFKSMYWFSVPALAISVIGLLWSLPVPEAFTLISPAMNWGSAFAMAAIVYYFVMSIPLGIAMTAVILGMLLLVHWLAGLPVPLSYLCGALFLGATALRLGIQKSRGETPDVLGDLQLLMIGPAWLVASIYRRLGIRY